MARIRVVEAGMAVEEKFLEKAAVLCAQSLNYALAYNKQTVDEIYKSIIEEISQAEKNGLLAKETYRTLYEQIAHNLTTELSESPLFYDSKRNSLATEITLNLRKRAKIIQ